MPLRTAWFINRSAIQADQPAPFAIDDEAFGGIIAWINKMTDPNYGQVGYNYPGGYSTRPEGLKDRFPPEKTHAMTAAGILCRMTLGEDPRASELIRLGANLCIELPPVWNPDTGDIDMYYWYFGTRAMSGVGGKYWSRWSKHLNAAVVTNQHPEGSGARTGSWDPIGVRGREGGRVYSTALLTMCVGTGYPPK